MMLYKSKQLAKLHHNEGCEDKRKTDEVKRGSKCNKTECFSYGSEENESYKCCRGQSRKIELAVGERSDLEERMLASHIECLDDLTECKDHKCHCLTLSKICIVALPSEPKPMRVSAANIHP